MQEFEKVTTDLTEGEIALREEYERLSLEFQELKRQSKENYEKLLAEEKIWWASRDQQGTHRNTSDRIEIWRKKPILVLHNSGQRWESSPENPYTYVCSFGIEAASRLGLHVSPQCVKPIMKFDLVDMELFQ